MAWSEDGVNEAPLSVGLEPGRQAANLRHRNFDLDTLFESYLAGYSFTITFTDGSVVAFDYDAGTFWSWSAGDARTEARPYAPPATADSASAR